MKKNQYNPRRITEAAEKVLGERYYLKDTKGKVVETAPQLWKRVAEAVASAEDNYTNNPSVRQKYAKKFEEMMANGDFLPNSPCLMNAGAGNGMSLSACFVLNIPDSLEGIMETAKSQALIQKTGGGTGFSLSQLRPEGGWINGTAGQSSGPISFLRILDTVTDSVKQGMKRRGANMGVLSISHPDIMKFINCKEQTGILHLEDGSQVVQYPFTNFNLSVGVTDAFMEALKAGNTYELIDPHTGKVTAHMPAQAVWDAMVHGAWKTGDPGCLFIDRANAGPANPIPDIEKIEATNPCGEQYLFDSDVCNLGSINLSRFVHPNGGFDWGRFCATTRLAIRFLDNVIDINPYPLPSIHKRAHELRRIGLGVMGWADLLILLGTPYDSDEARNLGNKIMEEMHGVSLDQSQDLARERGPFPMQSVSRYKNDIPRRNSNLCTVAPTGTISLLANCSSGIEPLFLLAYQHRVQQADKSWRVLNIVAESFRYIAEREGFWSSDLEEHVLQHGTVTGRDDVPEHWQRVLVTANDVHARDHILMQSFWQRHNDNSISKTINAPNETTEAEIDAMYRLAYDTGCLGITVYRDGCKQFQVLNKGKKEESLPLGSIEITKEAVPQAVEHADFRNDDVLDRPISLHGATHRVNGPGGNMYVTVNRQPENGEPFEVFINAGRVGSETSALTDAIGRLISLTLRLPSRLTRKKRYEMITEQLKGLGGSNPVGFGPNKVRSIPDGVAMALSMDQAEKVEFVTAPVPSAERVEVQVQVSGKPTVRNAMDLCPNPACGEMAVIREDGCMKCLACGWSACG